VRFRPFTLVEPDAAAMILAIWTASDADTAARAGGEVVDD
jgi:hypothetical protein